MTQPPSSHSPKAGSKQPKSQQAPMSGKVLTAKEAFNLLGHYHKQRSSHAPPAAAKHCTASIVAFVAEDHARLKKESAAFLEQLFLIWQNAGIDPEKIWKELKRRETLGGLLVSLNKKITTRKIPGQLKTHSTKLP
ncbi:phosphoribosyl-ATP pyrophosphatase [Entomobacter blattae]|uniref:Uncharacterized protein n=1 Tax=Entomobacter blattae TaxID=2762277 RepID=A0A7H1NQY8_9PROT|nr:hypothetical protein [Entomobacter blattae]QNT78198.1 hypothetical protein JGUZn3_09670 [Entomobacter blattae]